MKTLNQNELMTICGGFEPLNDWGFTPDNWDLQLSMDALAREQEAAFLRGMMMHQAD